MLVDEYKEEKRHSICDSCPEKRGDFQLFGYTLIKRLSQCRKCKCVIDLKVKFTDSKCPINKW